MVLQTQVHAGKTFADLGNEPSLLCGLLAHSNIAVFDLGSSVFAGKSSVLHCCNGTRQSLA